MDKPNDRILEKPVRRSRRIAEKDRPLNEISAQARSVVVERDFPYPPAKIWRALTQPHLIAEWLMKNDFAPVAGHHFDLTADWGSVSCEVLEVELNRTLSYTWAAMGLESIVTWTLTEAATGTHLRMEHTGFRPDQEQAFRGAQYGWQQFVAKLEGIVSRED